MSFESMAWAVKQDTGSPMSKLVLLMLSNYADDEHRCYPSIDHLANLCHCSVRTINRNIKELRDAGFIKVIKHPRKNMWNHNIYILGSDKSALLTNTTISSDTVAHNTNINKNKHTFKKRTKNKNFLLG